MGNTSFIDMQAIQSMMDYRTLVESSPDAVCVIDFEGNVLALSESAKQKFGYGLEDLSGTDAFNVVTDHLRDQVATDLETLRETGRLTSYEIAITREDGTEAFVEINDSTIKDEEGNPVQWWPL